MITLIRHGQAGSRISYDDLSDIGQRQARALGRWFHNRGIRFDRILTGSLQRQKKTAAAMGHAMEIDASAIETDPRWSEFDLDAVYAGIAPLIAREDAAFRAEYEKLIEEMQDPQSGVHRTWRSCDVVVVRAWVEERFEYQGESFSRFRERVHSALRAIDSTQSTAVVTSATPVALCVATALDLSAQRVMQIAGALRNTAFTEMVFVRNESRLVSFNNVPHLDDPALHTLR